jgi:hypothetical protein
MLMCNTCVIGKIDNAHVSEVPLQRTLASSSYKHPMTRVLTMWIDANAELKNRPTYQHNGFRFHGKQGCEFTPTILPKSSYILVKPELVNGIVLGVFAENDRQSEIVSGDQ